MTSAKLNSGVAMSTIRYETKLFRGCNQQLRSGRAGEPAATTPKTIG
jgi:hypothetical protein